MISVIVPAYNAETTLADCLSALRKSALKDFELLVVDDGSRDATATIATRFADRLIRVGENKGLSHARNTGIRNARNEILVFIDSDVVVKRDTLTRILRFFETRPEAAAVVGMLDTLCPHQDFFSQYKNLYMNYVFSKISSPVTFLYGSVHAIRKTDILPYDESLAYAEDTDLGQRLTKAGKTIILSKNLQVTHLKAHSAASLIRNDFRIPFHWAHLFFKYLNPGRLWRKKRFAHARASQLSSVFTSSLIMFTALLCAFFKHSTIPILGCLLLLFTLLNADFFRFLYQRKGVRFAVFSFLFTLADQVVMASGIAFGAIHHAFNRIKRKKSGNRPGALRKLNYWCEAKRVENRFTGRSVAMAKDILYLPAHYLCAIKPFREQFFSLFGTTGCYEPKNRGIVSAEHRFIYFYVPKVASTTLKRNLAKLLFDRDIERRVHTFWFNEVIDVKKGDYDSFFKFVFVRNPWDRMVSCYADKILHTDVTNYKYQNGVFRRYSKRFKGIFSMGMTFDNFIKVVCEIPDSEADRHFRSQHCFLTDENGHVLADFIGKFENLSEDYAHIARKCGLSDSPLPHENRSKRAKNYRGLYTPETRRLIAERYRKDIELFNYRF